MNKIFLTSKFSKKKIISKLIIEKAYPEAEYSLLKYLKHKKSLLITVMPNEDNLLC